MTANYRSRSLLLRVRTSWGWARLDREIAAGASLAQSEARSLRAKQLLRPEERRAIAAVLRTILDVAGERTPSGRRSQRAEHEWIIASHHDGLLQLIQLLRSDTPMTAAAVARAELLACSRDSPLVCVGAADTVEQALSEIASANTE